MPVIHSQLTGVHYITHAQTGRVTACNSVDKGTNASIPTIQFAVIATVQLVCMYLHTLAIKNWMAMMVVIVCLD